MIIKYIPYNKGREYMYNVKILKYPSGWQVRTYSRPVGYCDNDSVALPELIPYDNWYDDIQDYQTDFLLPQKAVWNPFDEQYQNISELQERDAECSARNSRNRSVNKIYHLSRSNVWDWFVTLTFNPSKVDSFDYGECTKNLHDYFHALRKKAPGLKYILVPELHQSGRYHFHGLLAACDGMEFVDSGHTCRDGSPIYNIPGYKLGFTTATRVKDNERVTKYLSKYITKDLCAASFGKKRYWASRNLNQCEEETMLLEYTDLSKLQEVLNTGSSYHKTVGDDLKTTYYELSEGMEI